ncbi:HPr family phosphocarrier protein [Cellulomonas sp. Root137]|uniref:HPr family phosphocarrier protein n=1 Tax=Cellulomonas sp. Root137 TaxID=1736459 RepID=UPI0006FD01EC|nr:HPr family phosphocarrier protein [Cellulomonas sp. Root137]KQY47305.1 dihydroxyacetone kinase [Cellulomonas sp. Root137]KRD44445.1 dihydroxyacetone kinase [Cellulomonas sp. Root930]
MTERTVAIASAQGLHARPASVFAQAAGAAGIPVTIAKQGGSPVNAASVLMVMTLSAGHGEEVVLTADGPQADDVLDSLVGLLATDLDADV